MVRFLNICTATHCPHFRNVTATLCQIYKKITVCSIGSLTAIQGFFFVFIIIFVFERAANMDSKAVDVSCFIQMISVLSNHLLL